MAIGERRPCSRYQHFHECCCHRPCLTVTLRLVARTYSSQQVQLRMSKNLSLESPCSALSFPTPLTSLLFLYTRAGRRARVAPSRRLLHLLAPMWPSLRRMATWEGPLQSGTLTKRWMTRWTSWMSTNAQKRLTGMCPLRMRQVVGWSEPQQATCTADGCRLGMPACRRPHWWCSWPCLPLPEGAGGSAGPWPAS